MAVSARPNKPSYYVVREAWIDDGPTGKDVVFDVLGVAADGSYWVTGVQVRIPKSDFDRMTADQVMALIRAKVKENEETLDSAYLKTVENENLTERLKVDTKVKAVLGSRIPVERPVKRFVE
jgi:Ser-tRNA(Ala) deacylase AlaX